MPDIFKKFTADDLQTGQVIPVNKPYGWTSFDVVSKLRTLIRRYYNIERIKIGHAGTLDPLATGLLLVCTGKMTKEIEKLQEFEKTYSGVMLLGATTPSFDKETEIDTFYPVEHINEDDINLACSKFTGTFLQVPPIYSAVKIKGKRAYAYARNKQDVQINAREVTISVFKINTDDFPKLSFILKCSKGTYIRSIVRDVGVALKTGAYLENLCREAIGNYLLSDALEIDVIEEILKNQNSN